MTVTPQPDRDSRYPDRYCTTCGKGFVGYLDCTGDNADDAIRYGIPMGQGCNQDGVVPAEPANPDWNKPLAAAVDTILSAKACPNAPMNATTVDRPWPTEPAPVIAEVWEQLKSAHADERLHGSFDVAGSVTGSGWTTDTKALAKAVEPKETGWTTVPIENKSQT